MTPRTIKVSSRALGRRETVCVVIYDTAEQMRRAAHRYNGADHEPDCLGITQIWEEDARVGVTVRLIKGRLGTQIVGHEMHHAAAAIYGASLGPQVRARRVLTHYNEPFAHLYSDLLARLVDRLYTLGYYDQEAA